MGTFEVQTWNVVDSYFRVNKGYQLVKHQLESFNDFILRKLEQIIHGFNNIEIHHQYMPEIDKFKYILHIDIKNPVLIKPIIYEKDGSTKLMTPTDARQRNFTYSSALTVDVHILTKTFNTESEDYIVEQKSINNVLLGKIPIMVKSNYCVLRNPQYTLNECKYDYGSYFIVNGNEKVVISQDRISENKPFVFVNNKVSAYSHIAEIRSVQENKLGVPKITTLKLSTKATQFGRNIRVNIHHIKNDIPLFILFKALGLNNDKEILKYIVYDFEDKINILIMNELTGCIEEANQVLCPKAALEYLSRYLNITGYPKEYLNNKYQRINIIRNILEKEFLPHVGTCFNKKALYLGYMVNKLLKCFLGLREFDDRDSYINKRVDTPGVLMANLFRQYYGKVIKDMKNLVQKEINNGGWRATNKFINVINKVNISKLIKATIIDSGTRYALATGNWGIKSNKNKQGVAQVLNRMTYSATLSHLRRINTPIEKSGKLVQPRKLHSTQWGIICPSECFAPDTPILTWDGSVKKAEDIVVGDYLIDDSGNATRVKSTCAGYKTMYEIIPDKVNFMNYTVTDNHILTLKSRNHTRNPTKSCKKYTFRWFNDETLVYKTSSFDNKEDLEEFQSKVSDVIDITIEKYLALPKKVQKELYVFKSDGINWEYKKVALDPYILGMWLGDPELLDKWIEWGKNNDISAQPGISPLKKLLEKYNLVNNKHIPQEYLVNDRKTRLAVLAGLIDMDGNVRANGHEVRITQGENNYAIIYDVEFLARSLGFSCHMKDSVNDETRQRSYKELTITGANLYEIPTILPRKKLNKFENPTSIKKCSSYLQSSFKLVKKEVQPYVGWQLEGNGRFLLRDMSVTHNTPEGGSVGLVKNMAMMASITISSNSRNVREIVEELGTVPFSPEELGRFYEHTKVLINGDIVGTHEFPDQLYSKLKVLKRKGCINIYTGIIWHILIKELHICTEGGRCVRPLYIVDENKNIRLNEETAKYSWQDLVIGKHQNVDDSVIEFMDVEEVNNAMIAMKYQDLCKGTKGSLLPIKYTHLEIHPSLILGVLASLIPFADHNQAPRVTYQSAQCKQAIGIYSLNYADRYDTIGHVLNTPQKPLVKTHMSCILNNDHMPNGVNAIVAIATYTGFNQEDSVILNKSAVERGLFVSTYLKTYKEQNNKNHSNGEEEFFTKPEIKSIKPYNYDKLQKDGFVPENTFVQSGDIIIGKCMPNKTSTLAYKDNSVPLKNNEKGFIDRNCYNDKYFSNINGDGYTFAKVRVRSDRTPTIGDKFSCYTPDHQVLSQNGWIDIDKLTKEDMVATLVDDTFLYQNPTEIQIYDYSGYVYHIDSPKVRLTVTPNHRMYVKMPDDEEFSMQTARSVFWKKAIYKKQDSSEHVVLPAHESWSYYQGKVYCCTVPRGEGVIYVRKQGMEIWSGQSRSSQKGTCGILYNQEDMPFTREGIVPDIIMNPHAIPSRMTIGQLLECIMGKICTSLGTYGEATPFTDVSVEELAGILQKHCGMERYGNEIMYNSRTGEQMSTEIFIGPTYYQRLKHMTVDKVHCLTKDHDVLTHVGWVSIDKVTLAHRIATLKNGVIVYQNPTKLLHYTQYCGRMYHVSNEHIDLNVTINHRMWVCEPYTYTFTLRKAEVLMGKYVWYQKNGIWDKEAILLDNVADMHSFLTLYGVCISQQLLDNNGQVVIKINNHPMKVIILEALGKLGYKYSVQNCYITIEDNIYTQMLYMNRNLPDWVWQLNSNQCQTLIYSMCMSDGIAFENNKVIYYTYSSEVADDFMRLCLHAGWSSTKEKDPLCNDLWKLPILIGQYNFSYVNDGGATKEEIYEYYGSVYCLEVPSEIFYVRRNGKACWTGNSRASSGPIVMLTHQPSDGRARDGGLRMGEMEVECCWAHGGLQFLKERMMECSDNYRVHVCKNCGLMAIVNPDKKIFMCKSCKNNTNFAQIRIPYACKLLFHEVQTMGIAARFITKS